MAFTLLEPAEMLPDEPIPTGGSKTIVTNHRTTFIALPTAACGGGQGDAVAPIYVDMEPVAATEAPESLSPALVLLEGGTACVTETYMYRIVCKEPGGESLVFGARGEGPGEFPSATRVLRGPDGMIGVMDSELRRLSLFAETGGFVDAVSGFPLGFDIGPGKMLAETVAGTTFDLSLVRTNVEIELATGRVRWERPFPRETDVVGCSTPGREGRQLGTGYAGVGPGLLFVACWGEFLVWYAGRDDAEPAAIVRSTYEERYPTDDEVASEMRLLQSASWFAGVDEEELRTRPKVWYGPRVADDRRRFWAVSHWETAEDVIPPMSYVDLYHLTGDGPRYALTLQLKDKVIGMDVLGDTLAVLVEAEEWGAWCRSAAWMRNYK